jgi:hypothetical protein
VTRTALAILCALALLLVGCAHHLTPAITALNTSSAFLTSAHAAIVNVQDAESAAAETREATYEAAAAAGARVDGEYEPLWSAYHVTWLVWVAGRAIVEAEQAADAAGGAYDPAKVSAAVLRLAEAQRRFGEATEALMARRAAK